MAVFINMMMPILVNAYPKVVSSTDSKNLITVQDFLGRYHSKEDYLTEITSKSGNISLRWKTGSDIYLDNTYHMVFNKNQLVNHPTEKARIKVSISKLQPKILSIFVDDNPEFEPFKTQLVPIIEQQKVNPFAETREEKKIHKIRKLYRLINNNLKQYTRQKLVTNDSSKSTEGQETLLYLDKTGHYRKIVESFYGEMGKKRMAYYFDAQGHLNFVLETQADYNAPIYITKTEAGMEAFDSKKSTITQNRYYFDTDGMFRWLSVDHQRVSSKSPKFHRKSEKLLTILKRYR